MSVILASAGYDQSIKFWEALSGICSRTIQNTDAQINRMAITPDKNYILCACAHKVLMYEIHSSNAVPFAKFEGHGGNVTSVAIQADGKWMVTSSEDGTVKVWDLNNPSQVQRSYKHDAPVLEVVIHPNQGELIACDSGGTLRVWDLGRDACTHQLIPDEEVALRSVSIASDGTLLAAGSSNGNVYVWRITSTKDSTALHPVTKFRAHTKYVTKVLLSPDAKHLATCSADHTARVWAVDNQFSLDTVLTGHQRWVWDCAFSADSAYLVTACSDHFVRLWELASGAVIRQYQGHHKGVLSVALNDV